MRAYMDDSVGLLAGHFLVGSTAGLFDGQPPGFFSLIQVSFGERVEDGLLEDGVSAFSHLAQEDEKESACEHAVEFGIFPDVFGGQFVVLKVRE